MKKTENSGRPPDANFQIRCPRLGHQIYFSYCRRENEGLPCAKTLDCWYPHFSVVEFLRRDLSAIEWRDAFERPAKPKMLSLLEMINRVQNIKEK